MINRFGTDAGRRRWPSRRPPLAVPGNSGGGKPIVAAINGDAVGWGLLALFRDATVTAEGAKFGDSHVKVGLPRATAVRVIWLHLRARTVPRSSSCAAN